MNCSLDVHFSHLLGLPAFRTVYSSRKVQICRGFRQSLLRRGFVAPVKLGARRHFPSLLQPSDPPYQTRWVSMAASKAEKTVTPPLGWNRRKSDDTVVKPYLRATPSDPQRLAIVGPGPAEAGGHVTPFGHTPSPLRIGKTSIPGRTTPPVDGRELSTFATMQQVVTQSHRSVPSVPPLPSIASHDDADGFAAVTQALRRIVAGISSGSHAAHSDGADGHSARRTLADLAAYLNRFSAEDLGAQIGRVCLSWVSNTTRERQRLLAGRGCFSPGVEAVVALDQLLALLVQREPATRPSVETVRSHIHALIFTRPPHLANVDGNGSERAFFPPLASDEPVAEKGMPFVATRRISDAEHKAHVAVAPYAILTTFSQAAVAALGKLQVVEGELIEAKRLASWHMRSTRKLIDAVRHRLTQRAFVAWRLETRRGRKERTLLADSQTVRLALVDAQQRLSQEAGHRILEQAGAAKQARLVGTDLFATQMSFDAFREISEKLKRENEELRRQVKDLQRGAVQRLQQRIQELEEDLRQWRMEGSAAVITAALPSYIPGGAHAPAVQFEEWLRMRTLAVNPDLMAGVTAAMQALQPAAAGKQQHAAGATTSDMAASLMRSPKSMRKGGGLGAAPMLFAAVLAWAGELHSTFAPLCLGSQFVAETAPIAVVTSVTPVERDGWSDDDHEEKGGGEEPFDEGVSAIESPALLSADDCGEGAIAAPQASPQHGVRKRVTIADTADSPSVNVAGPTHTWTAAFAESHPTRSLRDVLVLLHALTPGRLPLSAVRPLATKAAKGLAGPAAITVITAVAVDCGVTLPQGWLKWAATARTMDSTARLHALISALFVRYCGCCSGNVRWFSNMVTAEPTTLVAARGAHLGCLLPPSGDDQVAWLSLLHANGGGTVPGGALAWRGLGTGSSGSLANPTTPSPQHLVETVGRMCVQRTAWFQTALVGASAAAGATVDSVGSGGHGAGPSAGGADGIWHDNLEPSSAMASRLMRCVPTPPSIAKLRPARLLLYPLSLSADVIDDLEAALSGRRTQLWLLFNAYATSGYAEAAVVKPAPASTVNGGALDDAPGGKGGKRRKSQKKGKAPAAALPTGDAGDLLSKSTRRRATTVTGSVQDEDLSLAEGGSPGDEELAFQPVWAWQHRVIRIADVVDMVQSAGALTGSFNDKRVEAIAREGVDGGDLLPSSSDGPTSCLVDVDDFAEVLVRLAACRMAVLAQGDFRSHDRNSLKDARAALDAPTAVFDDAPVTGPFTTLRDALVDLMDVHLLRHVPYLPLSDIFRDLTQPTVQRLVTDGAVHSKLSELYGRYASSVTAGRSPTSPADEGMPPPSTLTTMTLSSLLRCVDEQRWLSPLPPEASGVAVDARCQVVALAYGLSALTLPTTVAGAAAANTWTIDQSAFFDISVAVALRVRGAQQQTRATGAARSSPAGLVEQMVLSLRGSG